LRADGRGTRTVGSGRGASVATADEGAHDVNRLYRPRGDRWIAGVCSGLARRFGLSSGMVRLIFVVSCLLPGPQFLIYLVLWAVMPNE
jgi:phage shock protein PspC (stress-responsive transcriptional regulator)